MLRRGGTATVIGMIAPGVKIEIKGTDFLAEKRIQGSMMGSNRFPVDMPRRSSSKASLMFSSGMRREISSSSLSLPDR